MNLSDVVDRMAEKTGRPATESKKMAEALLDAVRAGLAEDGRVELCGFGVLDQVQMPDRVGRSFVTGATMPVRGKLKIRFKASKSFATGKRSPYDWRLRAHAVPS